MPNTIKLTKDGHIANIQFNRPNAMNTLNDEMAKDMLDTLVEAENDDDIKVIIFSGAGPCFMAGGDINFFHENINNMSETIDGLFELVHETIELIHNSRKIIIASAHKAVAGYGFSLIMACDLAIATKNTQFSLAYSNIGATPDGGSTYMLPRIVGHKKAMELALFSNSLSSEEAKELGFLNIVTEDDDLSKITKALANKVASGPSLVFARIKNLMQHSWHNHLLDQLYAEQQAFKASTQTNDFKEGITAFLNKQPPSFEGK